MSRGVLALGMLAVVPVVWFGRHAVFTDLDRQQWAARHPVYGRPLHLHRTGRWEWTLPHGALPDGEAQCKLVLAQNADAPSEHYEREKMPLRLRVLAQQGSAHDRKTIFETRFPVDRPNVGSSYSISSFANDQVKHTIGTIHLRRELETRLTVDVETPDTVLELAQPRFELVGAYDYAAMVPGAFLLLVRDLVAGSVALLFGVSAYALASEERRRRRLLVQQRPTSRSMPAQRTPGS